MNFIFPHNFYTQFVAPNSEQLFSKLNGENKIDNDFFAWGNKCDVDRIPLKSEDYISLLQPSIDKFSDGVGKSFNFIMSDPWLNLYKQGGFQEVHDHCDGSDISCVFFLNGGNNFFFRDRYNTEISFSMSELLNYFDYFVPEVNAGDIMFFPSYLMHGVSPNTSGEIRKTFSCNFKLLDVGK